MQVRATQNPECGEIPPILRKHFSNGTYRNTTKKGTGKFTQDVYISDNVLKEQGKQGWQYSQGCRDTLPLKISAQNHQNRTGRK